MFTARYGLGLYIQIRLTVFSKELKFFGLDWDFGAFIFGTIFWGAPIFQKLCHEGSSILMVHRYQAPPYKLVVRATWRPGWPCAILWYPFYCSPFQSKWNEGFVESYYLFLFHDFKWVNSFLCTFFLSVLLMGFGSDAIRI